jgi:uncharacterized phage-associated protein
MSKYKIDEIANYILYFANEAGSLITPLKLQKLAYYAQAWHLAVNNEPLFDGEFEAWVHGPVNRDLYDRFRSLKFRPIMEDVAEPALDAETKEFMHELFDEYLGLDAYELELLTHREEPWTAARGPLSADALSQSVISQEVMRRYYKAQMNG